MNPHNGINDNNKKDRTKAIAAIPMMGAIVTAALLLSGLSLISSYQPAIAQQNTTEGGGATTGGTAAGNATNATAAGNATNATAAGNATNMTTTGTEGGGGVLEGIFGGGGEGGGTGGGGTGGGG